MTTLSGYLEGEFNERNVEISPDGNWMAYQSNESGAFEIFVSPFPNVDDGKQQVSNSGGIFPVWAKSGQELFYVEPGPPARLMTVPIQTGPTFSPGNPEPVFPWNYYLAGPPRRTFDVAPGGERFLVLSTTTDESGDGPWEIITVLNWFEELKERVPVP